MAGAWRSSRRIVDPALLEGRGRRDELRLGGPADLALDLLDEALDPRRGAERLLPLEGDEGGLVLLIREVDLDEPAGQQGAPHQGHDDDDVLPEQPPAPRPGSRRIARSIHEECVRPFGMTERPAESMVVRIPVIVPFLRPPANSATVRAVVGARDVPEGRREGGANPPRPRHCNRGRNPREPLAARPGRRGE